MILVDTSIWIDHLRASNEMLVQLLTSEQVIVHPFIIGELAVGHFRNGRGALERLAELPEMVVVEPGNVLHFIEANRLYGQGIGYVDAHLLASLRITSGVRLWTADRRLSEIASRFDLDARLTS